MYTVRMVAQEEQQKWDILENSRTYTLMLEGINNVLQISARATNKDRRLWRNGYIIARGSVGGGRSFNIHSKHAYG